MAAFDPEKGKSSAARTVSDVAAGGKNGPIDFSSISSGGRVNRYLSDGRSGLGNVSEFPGSTGGRFGKFASTVGFGLASIAWVFGVVYFFCALGDLAD